MTDTSVANTYDSTESEILLKIQALVAQATDEALARAQTLANTLLTIEQARSERSGADDLTE